MSEAYRVAVLASGSGSNFQAILDRLHAEPASPVRVTRLVASQGGIGAIERAEAAGVPVSTLPGGSGGGPEGEEGFLLRTLREADADLVVLAGYLRLVPARVVRACWGRMINIHPALLPAFGGEGMYGARVHRAVLQRGARVTGVTVHFVDEAYDRGPIVAQWPVPVLEDDTPEALAARVLAVEHRVLPAVVDALSRDEVALDESGVVRWRRPWFPGARFRAEDDSVPLGIAPPGHGPGGS